MAAIKYINTGVRQANTPMQSFANGSRFPSVAHETQAPALGAPGRVDVYDLFGRRTEGMKANRGAFLSSGRTAGCRGSWWCGREN